MKEVSFRDAELIGVTFSNECDLSTVELPRNGNYKLFDNWNERLNYVKASIDNLPSEQREKAELFVKIHKVHSVTQEWYLLNVHEVTQEFGTAAGERIITVLTGFS
jgi:hypothetical protein